MKILVYRMFFHGAFEKAVRAYDSNIIFFSSERRMDETGTISRYYDTTEEAVIDNATLFSIIYRCRYLSGINVYEASKKVRKMWASVSNYVAENPIDLILTPAVDNYVTDIWFRIAETRGILALQPRRSPLQGLVRITNGLDNRILREPSKEEIRRNIILLSNKFKADYQNIEIRTAIQITRRFLKEVGKKIIFEIWKMRYKDPDSYHYNAIYPNKNSITFKSISQLWYHKKFKQNIHDIKKNKINYEKTVFWPLAMAPESALCYLNEDYSFSNYENVLNIIASTLPDNILLVVKEHPSAIGYRNVEQFRQLENKNNIIIIKPSESTSEIIKSVDAVLIKTSATTGLEAVANGKPVLAIGSCHYNIENIVDEIPKLAEVVKWFEKIRFVPLHEHEKEEVFRKYLSNTVDNATWALAGTSLPDYQQKINNTLHMCIKLLKK